MNGHTWSEEVYAPGDAVWLRMGDSIYSAVITQVCAYSDTHDDGYECRQYHADVTFPVSKSFPDGHVTRDGLVSQCMLSRREEVAQ